MTGAGARKKGHDFEREMVRTLREVFTGADVHRGLQYRDGAEAPDVVCPVFHVECKRGRRTSPKVALKQAIGDCSSGKIPIAICKDDRCDPTVTIGLEDFLEFLREWWTVSQRS